MTAPKSLFSSFTFWVLILMVLQAAAPKIEQIAETGKLTPKDAADLFNLTISSIALLVSRMSEDGPLYTPRGLPGANKADLLKASADRLVDKL